MNDLSKRSQRLYASLMHIYEVRPRKDQRGSETATTFAMSKRVRRESITLPSTVNARNRRQSSALISGAGPTSLISDPCTLYGARRSVIECRE